MIRLARIRTALAALLLGSALALPLAQGLAPQAAHAASGPTAAQASILGYWHNTDPNTRSVTLLHVSYSTWYQADRVDVWAKCFPRDCYWGTQTVSFDTPTVGAAYYWFNFDSQRNIVSMQRNGSQLNVTVQINHALWDTRPQTITHLTFAPGT